METLRLRQTEEHGVEKRLRGEAYDAESGSEAPKTRTRAGLFPGLGRKQQRNRDRDERGLLLRGRGRHRATHDGTDRTRLADEFLGRNPNTPEYGWTTVEGSQPKDSRPGMRAGIAMKSGNADGVKALTDQDRGWTNINYTQR